MPRRTDQEPAATVLALRLDRRLKEALERTAIANDRTMSSEARRILRKALIKEEEAA